ncbi:glycerol kinase 1 [Spirochaetia bacterium]|nr:glycerol kinase 1 [Spirochaetia bacterium]
MKVPFILVIDQSTSGTKALIFDSSGDILCRCDRAHEQKISSEGWVSHDPMEIYRNTLAAVADAVKGSGIDPADISGVGISNQRETALVWGQDGKPLTDAVVWQCVRGEEICAGLADHGEEIRSRTGLPLSPYFSAAKIAWILKHSEGAREKKLCAGTINSWLVFCLTGNFKTDYSNASRTQLLNLTSLDWDKRVCDLFKIDPAMLGEICDSNALYGHTDFEGLLPKPVPIRAVMGDSHAALYGQGCLKKGMGKATYGTGSSVMVNIGEAPLFCRNVVTSLAWGIDGRVNYVLEGNINYTGAVIKWLVEDLGLIRSPGEAGPLAAQANPADTTFLVPAFSGLGAPYWAPHARASFCGMTRSTHRAELVKAAEESIAFQITDCVKAIQDESGLVLSELRADGGAARDEFLMHFQSDMLNLPLSVPSQEELSATGVAYLAGITLGVYSVDIFSRLPRRTFIPSMDAEIREKRYRLWQDAVRRVMVPLH